MPRQRFPGKALFDSRLSPYPVVECRAVDAEVEHFEIPPADRRHHWRVIRDGWEHGALGNRAKSCSDHGFGDVPADATGCREHRPFGIHSPDGIVVIAVETRLVLPAHHEHCPAQNHEGPERDEFGVGERHDRVKGLDRPDADKRVVRVAGKK